MAFRAGPTRLGRHWSPDVKRLYWIIGGVLIAVALTVLFVPGVGNSIEGRVLGWLVRLAG